MKGRRTPSQEGDWTRGRLLRMAVGGGAVIAGGTYMGARAGDNTSVAAAPSADGDVDILNLYLTLEFVQEDFYRAALDGGGLDGDLAEFATTVSDQEREHVALLTERLGDRAKSRPTTDFGDALSTPERFRSTAVELEEAAIAAYIAQGGNLTLDSIRAVATLLSVEARQAAWIRDLAGKSPAPRAADPPRTGDEVLKELRTKGFIG